MLGLQICVREDQGYQQQSDVVTPLAYGDNIFQRILETLNPEPPGTPSPSSGPITPVDSDSPPVASYTPPGSVWPFLYGVPKAATQELFLQIVFRGSQRVVATHAQERIHSQTTKFRISFVFIQRERSLRGPLESKWGIQDGVAMLPSTTSESSAENRNLIFTYGKPSLQLGGTRSMEITSPGTGVGIVHVSDSDPDSVEAIAAVMGSDTDPAAPVCSEGNCCSKFGEREHMEAFTHPWCRRRCENYLSCPVFFENPRGDHARRYTHLCRFGGSCRNRSKERCSHNLHRCLPACPYGKTCEVLDPNHRESHEHPGSASVLIPCVSGFGCSYYREYEEGVRSTDVIKHLCVYSHRPQLAEATPPAVREPEPDTTSCEPPETSTIRREPPRQQPIASIQRDPSPSPPPSPSDSVAVAREFIRVFNLFLVRYKSDIPVYLGQKTVTCLHLHPPVPKQAALILHVSTRSLRPSKASKFTVGWPEDGDLTTLYIGILEKLPASVPFSCRLFVASAEPRPSELPHSLLFSFHKYSAREEGSYPAQRVDGGYQFGRRRVTKKLRNCGIVRVGSVQPQMEEAASVDHHSDSSSQEDASQLSSQPRRTSEATASESESVGRQATGGLSESAALGSASDRSATGAAAGVAGARSRPAGTPGHNEPVVQVQDVSFPSGSLPPSPAESAHMLRVCTRLAERVRALEKKDSEKHANLVSLRRQLKQERESNSRMSQELTGLSERVSHVTANSDRKLQLLGRAVPGIASTVKENLERVDSQLAHLREFQRESEVATRTFEEQLSRLQADLAQTTVRFEESLRKSRAVSFLFELDKDLRDSVSPTRAFRRRRYLGYCDPLIIVGSRFVDTRQVLCGEETVVLNPREDASLLALVSDVSGDGATEELFHSPCDDWRDAFRCDPSTVSRRDIMESSFRKMIEAVEGICLAVIRFFGGPLSSAIQEQSELAFRGTRFVRLGNLRGRGIVRHRALCLKYLCDLMGIPCRLHRIDPKQESENRMFVHAAVRFGYTVFVPDLATTGKLAVFDADVHDWYVPLLPSVAGLEEIYEGMDKANISHGNFANVIGVLFPKPGSPEPLQLAVKEINITCQTQSRGEGVRIILREAYLLQLLSHPNVVEVLGAFRLYRARETASATAFRLVAPQPIAADGRQRDDIFCIVMKAYNMDGNLLCVRLQQLHTSELLQTQEVLVMLLSVCSGLQYLHGQGMWHLDLKPANILVMWDVDSEQISEVRLCDFSGVRRAETKIVLQFTPGFSAPELTTRGAQFDHRADIYSFGAVMHHFRELYLLGYPVLIDLCDRCLRETPVERPSLREIMSLLRSVLLLVDANLKDRREN